MICPSCKKREASIHITQNVNGQTTQIDLCPVCAKEQGYLGEAGNLAESVFGGDSFGGAGVNLFQMAGGISGIGGAAFAVERCAYCGTSFDEFRNRGLLGCCHCYEEFSLRLLPVIRRIQAGENHTGRRPSGAAGAKESAPEAGHGAKPPAAPSGTKPPEAGKPPLKRPTRVPKNRAVTTSPAPAPVPIEAAAAPPMAEDESSRLRREQAEAVKAEDYEKAAKIRDRIRALGAGKETGASS